MNILTFDVEEWFHLLDNASTKTEKEWATYPCRIYGNMDRIFDILERHDQKATFFIIGWIAKRYPEVVKRISNKGYDIGFHTNSHQLIYDQTPEEFHKDLVTGLDCIENIVGKKITAFRAPGFSLTEKCNWAFDILSEEGILYDSSVFPIHHAHGGYPSFPSIAPALIKTDKGNIREFPISVGKFFGKSMVYTGGGYFRLFPYWMIKNQAKKSPYIMSYLHPRDMDAGQPVIPDLSLTRKFRSYIGLKHAAAKLEKWITDFTFTDIQTASDNIDWEQVPIIDMRKKSEKTNC
ncbi:MAG TPA: polysaccharide deacetylase [Porphyromonadaceae bacterium]|jgi:polysaccharide deacetylase family protein (PEP-CTERM system associated)|nr:polysaccharide deacetylase [Porphyromonadaceae bacterium]HCM19289.1 polysaccharide deacetylase [Porphyromonadaceae bacterium]